MSISVTTALNSIFQNVSISTSFLKASRIDIQIEVVERSISGSRLEKGVADRFAVSPVSF